MFSFLQVTLDFENAAQNADLSGAETTFPNLITSVISGVMVIAALLVLMYFIWAGVEWITAGGDSSKIEKARTKITQSVIGIIVLSMAFAFFFLLQDFLGIEIFSDGGSSSSSGGPSSSSRSSSSFRETLQNSETRSFGLPTRKSEN